MPKFQRFQPTKSCSKERGAQKLNTNQTLTKKTSHPETVVDVIPL